MKATQRAKHHESMACPQVHGSADAIAPVRGVASGAGLAQTPRPCKLVAVTATRAGQPVPRRRRQWAYRVRAGLVVALALAGLITLATQVSMVVVPAQRTAIG